MASNHHPADTHDFIRVQGARVNNLKDITVELPKRRLTVFTGVSGSGKSSLVFGTIAAESQRPGGPCQLPARRRQAARRRPLT
jgi:ABC-type lipoprotein export system ATPase subunit